MKEYSSIKPQYDMKHVTNTYIRMSGTRKRIYLSILELLDTYPFLANQNIIIFGAGSCIDLPIDFICDMFSEIVLVDINTSALEGTRQYIPENSINKVSFVTFDVTGMRHIFTEEFNKRKPGSIEEILKFMMDMVSTIPDLILPAELACKAPFALTISDLLITQLTTYLLVNLVHPYILENIDANYNILNFLHIDEIYYYASEMAFQHLKLLYDVTKKDTGKIMVLSDALVYSTELDECKLKFNEIIDENPQYLLRPEIIPRYEVMKWLADYALPGGNISVPLIRHSFNKFDHTIQRWWWTPISERNNYFVLENILTPQK